ncbi:MAG: hypothetical protein ACOVSR_00750 [Bacteroidia bacterium]
MKKTILTLLTLLLLNICSVNAQKFYVEKTDNGYEQPIIDKLISEGYKISFKKDSADYTVMCIIGKTGMGRAKGSVAIIDNKSGDLLIKSKEVGGQTAIWNGYANPKMIAMKKISDDYLIDMIKKIIK